MAHAASSVLDPNEVPRYSVREAAHYLRMPESTLTSWVAGRRYDTLAEPQKYWGGLIRRPDEHDIRLSFSNLIEAYVLNALRKQYRVKMRDVRTALDYARHQLGVERILLSKDLRVLPGSVFLQRLGRLVDVGRGGQEALPEILEAYLERIEWDELGSPFKVFPFTRADHRDAPRVIAINPRVAFGRPVVERRSISTSAIAERFKAGESILELADDYDLEASEVEEAIRYETVPLAA